MSSMILVAFLAGVFCFGLLIFFAVLLLSVWRLNAAVVRLVGIVEPIAANTSLPSLAKAVVVLAENGPAIGQHIEALMKSVSGLQAVLFASESQPAPPAGYGEYRQTPPIGSQAVRENLDAVRRPPEPLPVTQERPAYYTAQPGTEIVPATDENSGVLGYSEADAALREEQAALRRQGIETDENVAGPVQPDRVIVAEA